MSNDKFKSVTLDSVKMDRMNTSRLKFQIDNGPIKSSTSDNNPILFNDVNIEKAKINVYIDSVESGNCFAITMKDLALRNNKFCNFNKDYNDQKIQFSICIWSRNDIRAQLQRICNENNINSIPFHIRLDSNDVKSDADAYQILNDVKKEKATLERKKRQSQVSKRPSSIQNENFKTKESKSFKSARE